MPVLSEKSPVTFRDKLPEAVDVVIIGGGIAGICTALFLARDGVSVLVCEKGRVAGEQSSRNWGWVRQMGRDEAELPIMMDSIQLWEGLAGETDNQVGFGRGGTMYLADNEEEQAELEQWLPIGKQHGLDTRAVSRGELQKMLAGAADKWCGGLYTASDGRAEPFQAVPAIARVAQAAGSRIIENCAVRSIDAEAGRTCGVITEQGLVRAGAVVCAAGAWSTTFLGNLGISLPQLVVRNTVARTGRAPEVFPGCAGSHRFAFRRRQDGGYTLALSDHLEHFPGADSFRYLFKFRRAFNQIRHALRLRPGKGLFARLFPQRRWQADEVTPFERTRVLNPEPYPWAVEELRRRMAEHLPGLAGVDIEESWAGMIEAMPDFVPVLDQVPGYPGFYLATGFSGHGFGIGPGAGRVMARLVQGNPPGYDLTRFRFSRFSDGSPIIPGPAV